MTDLPPSTEPTAPRTRRGTTVLVGSVVGTAVLLAGAFGLYETIRPGGKPIAHSGACARSLDLAQRIDPLVHGEIAALTLARAPRDLAAVAFDDADGHKTSVAAFAGKTILLNLWATWCVPCRAEMPALDRLQAQLGSKSFTVVPIDVDTVRLEKARSFFKDIGASSLSFYADNSADILRTLAAQGLPTTILIGRDGCEIASMAGPAQWDSPEAKALIEKVGSSSPAAT